jgi:4-aminobutyrate aminotransferase-like enzyme
LIGNILISASGRTGNVLKIRPPLPFSTDNVDQLLEGLEAVLGQLT